MSIDPDSRFVRPAPLQLEGHDPGEPRAEGRGGHAAEPPGLVPGQRDACAEGGEAGDTKVRIASGQESDWYQQPLPESVDHAIPDIGKACARSTITIQTRIAGALAAELSTDPRRVCAAAGGPGSLKSTATGAAS